MQLKRFTSVKENCGDTRTADRIASVVTHVRGREDWACKADGTTAERAARAEPPPTAAEPQGWRQRRMQRLAVLPTTHQT